MRQKGRLAAKSVLNCGPNKDSITNAIQCAVDRAYKKANEKIENPYGSGDASSLIIEMIKSLDGSIMKTFYDIKSGDAV